MTATPEKFDSFAIASKAKGDGNDPLEEVIAHAMYESDRGSREEFEHALADTLEWLRTVGVPQRRGKNDYARIYLDDQKQWRYRVFAGNHRLISASEDGKATRQGVLRELKREWPHVANISEEREA
jgi:hypothetical protein